MDGGYFKNLVSAMEPLLDEAKLNFYPEAKLTVRGMEPGKVAMLDIECSAGMFKEYECDKNFLIGISMIELSKIAKRISSSSVVELRKESGKSSLDIVLEGKYKSKFSMKMLETVHEKLPVPKVKSTYIVKLFTKPFLDALDDIALYSTLVTFKGEKDKLLLTGSGDVADVSIELLPKSETCVSITSEVNQATSTYQISYVKEIIKGASGISDVMILGFGKTKPMEIVFNQPKVMRAKFWVAPRVPG